MRRLFHIRSPQSMSETVRPAPVWRRLAAAIYDGLLLVALWMVTSLFDVMIRDAVKLARNFAALQVLEFSIGLLFFGWFWIHGGQTLGMRVWRLQVRRPDGSPLRWPIAAVRYSVMILTWTAVVVPALMQSPQIASHVHAGKATAVSVIIAAIAAVMIVLDGRKRALCDWAAGTEVVELPKKAA